MDRGRAADTLVVREDGTYRHRYVTSSATAVTDSGRWSINTLDGDRLITFAQFTPRWRTESSPSEARPTGWWPVQAERTLGGTVRLPVDDDFGWAYVRIAPER
jgi:hypothetical protein